MFSVVGAGYVHLHPGQGRKRDRAAELADDLDEASKAVLLRELKEKMFAPKILRVADYKDEFGVTSLTAETDRGMVTFQIRSRDDVRVLSNTRALFRDADGNTYELADLNALDAAGRKCLQDYF